MASKKVQTYIVKRTGAPEGELPLLVHGTQKQVEAHVIAQHSLEPATHFDINALGKAGVEIQNVGAD